MTALPTFITFTGLDEDTDLDAFAELTRYWPVEAAILFSPKRQGIDPRYPSMGWVTVAVNKLRWLCSDKIRFSAHLCGDYSRLLVDHKALPGDLDRLIAEHFARVQVNGAPAHTADHMADWGGAHKASIVLQAPKQFEQHPRVSFLLDGSSGRGVSPDSWPPPPAPNAWVGYAGGLNPDNVVASVQAIGSVATYYWLDMETGVRTNDWLSVGKCRDVCKAVYGGGEGC